MRAVDAEQEIHLEWPYIKDVTQIYAIKLLKQTKNNTAYNLTHHVKS